MKPTKTALLLLTLLIITPLTLATPQLIEEARTTTPQWEEGINVEVNELHEYEETIYKVLQEHTTQTGWEPPAVPALYTEHTFQNLGEISVYKQPLGAHDAYNQGDRVLVNNAIYESLQDNNVWHPTTEPTLWENIGTLEELQTRTEVLESGNVFYNKYASLATINGTNPTNVEITNRAITATQQGNGSYELTYYTGNHEVLYGLRNNETNDYLEATSQEGYVTFLVNHFSTWSLSPPNCEIDLGTVGTSCGYALENYMDNPNNVDFLTLEYYDGLGGFSGNNLIQLLYVDENEDEKFLTEDYLWSSIFTNQNADPKVFLLEIDADGPSVTTPTTGEYSIEIFTETDMEVVDITVIDSAPSGGGGTVFFDDFNRPDSSSVGNNWIESETHTGFEIKNQELYALDRGIMTQKDTSADKFAIQLVGGNYDQGLGLRVDFKPRTITYTVSWDDNGGIRFYSGTSWVTCESNSPYIDGDYLIIDSSMGSDNDFQILRQSQGTLSTVCSTQTTTYNILDTGDLRLDTTTSGIFQGDNVCTSDELNNCFEATGLTQTSNIPDVTLTLTEEGTRDFLEVFYNDHFEGYEAGDEIFFDFSNTGTIAEQVSHVLGTSAKTFNSGETDKSVVQIDDTRILQLTPQKQEAFANGWLRTHALNINPADGSAVGNNFEVALEFTSEVTQTFPNVNLNINQQLNTWILDDYFSYVGEYKVSFLDGMSTVILQEGDAPYTVTDGSTYSYDVELTSSGNLVFSHDGTQPAPQQEFTILASGVDDEGTPISQEVEQTFTFQIVEDPITVLQTPEDYTVNESGTYTYVQSEYYQDYEGFQLIYNDGTTNFNLYDEGDCIQLDHDGTVANFNSGSACDDLQNEERSIRLVITSDGYVAHGYRSTASHTYTIETYTGTRTSQTQTETASVTATVQELSVVNSEVPTRDIEIVLESTTEHEQIGFSGDDFSDYFENEEFYLVRYGGEEIFLTDQYIVKLTDGTTYTGLNDNLQITSVGSEVQATDSVTGNSFVFSDLELRVVLYPAFTNVDTSFEQELFVQSTNEGEYDVQVVGYRGEYDETSQTLIIDSEASRNVTVNVLPLGTTPSNGVGEASSYFWNSLLNIFPDEEGLSTGQKLGISALLLMAILGFGAYAGSQSNTGRGLINILTAGAGVVMIFFLTGIGYIPVWVTGVLVIGVVFFIISRTTNIGLGGQ